MKSSPFTPMLVYINVPGSILFPNSPVEVDQRKLLIEGVMKAGYIFIMPTHITAAAHFVVTRYNLEMPFADVSLNEVSKSVRARINGERQQFVRDVLGRIKIRTKDKAVEFVVDGLDITSYARDAPLCRPSHYQTWINGIHLRLRELFELQSSAETIAYIAIDPPRITRDSVNPNIGIMFAQDQSPQTGRKKRLQRKSDFIIYVETAQSLSQQLKDAVSNFTDLRKRRAALKGGITTGHIKLEDQFTRDTWPSHPLIAHTKQIVRDVVQVVIEEQQAVCDPLDLEYQTLFRLTSLPISSVFEDGDKLEAYLRSHGAYGYWRNILTLDPVKVAHPIRRAVVEKVAQEQLSIVLERLNDATLPIGDITQRGGIFSEPNWKLQKYGGNVMAIKVEFGRAVVQRKVYFKSVDVGYARKLHESLHYIHTPRATKAFGLFLENEKIPFSVVAFDAIDRAYKEDLLLMLGFEPSKCLDLARLYSKPGTPFNTSSTIFTLAFAYFRQYEPEVQAVLSAFMPSYAHGMSMISAGFNYGSLVKEWKHSFAQRNINGKEAWELVTKRRIDGNQTTIESQWPLLPVFELLSPIRPPRFEPFPELKGTMVSRNL